MDTNYSGDWSRTKRMHTPATVHQEIAARQKKAVSLKAKKPHSRRKEHCQSRRQEQERGKETGYQALGAQEGRKREEC
jgi:hypothetical protein